MPDKIWPGNSGIITPNKDWLPECAQGIIKMENGGYLMLNGGWTTFANSAPSMVRQFDRLYNRKMDLITFTPDKEKDGIEKTIKYPLQNQTD